MYYWTCIAVTEEPGGRVLAPTNRAMEPGRAMGEDRAALFLHGPQQAVDLHGAGDAGRVPVAAVVAGLGLDDHHGRARHRLLQVDDPGRRAGRGHAAGNVVDVALVGLREIGDEGDDVEAFLLQTRRHRFAV